MVWYAHLFQNFLQFVVIPTVKAFGIVNKAEIDVFLEFSCFFDDPVDVGNRALQSLAANNIINLIFGIDHLVMSMYRVISCVVGKRCLL